MVNDLTLTAIVWYYFNILGISGIIFFMLAIMYQRAGRTMVNTGERQFKPDNMAFRFTAGIAIFGIIFFSVREWGNDIWNLSQTAYSFVGGYFG